MQNTLRNRGSVFVNHFELENHMNQSKIMMIQIN